MIGRMLLEPQLFLSDILFLFSGNTTGSVFHVIFLVAIQGRRPKDVPRESNVARVSCAASA
jgi:hypothetical protein